MLCFVAYPLRILVYPCFAGGYVTYRVTVEREATSVSTSLKGGQNHYRSGDRSSTASSAETQQTLYNRPYRFYGSKSLRSESPAECP